MSPAALVALVMAALAATAVIVLLVQLWLMGSAAERPVGPWRSQRPDPRNDPPLPREFRSLIWGEAQGWQRPDQWRLLTVQLSDLERQLSERDEPSSGPPPAPPPPAPRQYSAAWLEKRLQELDALAGPLPSPLAPAPEESPKRTWILTKLLRKNA